MAVGYGVALMLTATEPSGFRELFGVPIERLWFSIEGRI